MTDGQTYTTQNTYNLSGALVEQTYPSGRKVKNTLDQTGDLAKVESKRNAADFYRNYATSFVYTAAGALSSVRLGNGEQFHKTILNEFYQIVFRKKLYQTIEELQADVDQWMQHYNTERPHLGKDCYGKTPMETFAESRHLAQEKALDNEKWWTHDSINGTSTTRENKLTVR